MTRTLIGADWGTTNARFFRLNGDGAVIAEAEGPGAARLVGEAAFEDAFFTAADGWLEDDPLILLAGMVGSNIGWRAAGYAEAPADAAAVATSAARFEARGRTLRILPGVRCTRSDGAPDVLRGEEVQIFGADADGLVCLPGTHAKWARVAGGSVLGFQTALTGELMDLLGRESVLLNPRRPVRADPGEAFDAGVEMALRSPLGLESLLFTTRSRQIAGVLAAPEADSYLAGLCIGSEVKSALHQGTVGVVTVVGADVLASLYSRALQAYGVVARRVSGREAFLAGLHLIAGLIDP